MSITEIPAENFAQMVKEGQDLCVLDVRTGLECASVKMGRPFIHIPLHELNPEAFLRSHGEQLEGEPLYILCRRGGRARKAAESLAPFIEQIVIVTGGLDACCECKMPVTQAQIFSLERQVRIAAGFFVLSGIALGHYVSGGFYALSAFVGAGLIFAGITDKCGMALILARAPWNIQR